MERKATYTVKSNQKIARDVYKMWLAGPTGMLSAPGQFVNIQLEGFYLRRPFSVCRWDAQGLEVVYKVVGGGTEKMAALLPGTRLELLSGLGNGFSAQAALGKKAVLVGGGCGVPPLYSLADLLCAAGTKPVVVLGFGSAEDVFYEEEFHKLGCEVHIATEDGTKGMKGYATALLKLMDFEHYFACGPMAMLKAVHAIGREKGAAGQLSFEERMGCGFGACMGCVCETLMGPKRICVDGPVFASREVMFQ